MPWRWTNSTGLQTLGPAPAGFTLNPTSDVSGDGSIVVGYMNDGSDSRAFRWTQSTGIEVVPGIGGAYGPFLSRDGTTIVGKTVGTSLSARRWTQATGAQPLGPLTGLPLGNGSALIGYGVSADGSVVVGTGEAVYQNSPTLTTAVPFRWTQATGSVGILNNGQFYNPQDGAGASSVSADGAVIVGYSGSSAWRWTAGSGFQTIVNPPPIAGSFLPSISGNGLTVVYREFIWTQTGGAQQLTDALTAAGCTFTGWTGLRVIDTSSDGRSLCGYGTNPTGQREAWYATIPAPGVPVLLAASGAVANRRRRRSHSFA